jgi:predicted nucleic acid-binding protein
VSVLIDTDVLIWYFRGDRHAFDVIEKQNVFHLSVVTCIELIEGMRNKRELNEMKNALASWRAKTIFVNETISAKAMFFIERHFLSHSLRLADALIAATAVANGLPLLTGNDRHYRVIKELEIMKFKPEADRK